ncbi:MAG: DUF6473 family protein [Roseobacter sp.]|jgi:hypothetical protein|nr:DUF6473 family protein [Roseobacter sp.]
MSYDVLGAGALNYAPCRYSNARVLFRGPQRRLDAPYIAFLGGTETYGKFIKTPFPALVESHVGVNCINFGIPNAGLDVFANEGFLQDACLGAKTTVVQIVGAQNLSNRFYSVHPRRNDRFVSASPLLRSIYPEVDFSEFHFTGHMLNALYKVSLKRFDVVLQELQDAWSARMKLLLRRIRGNAVLLWFADHAPREDAALFQNPSEYSQPLFVTRQMIDGITAHAKAYAEVVASPKALQAGTQGMVFSDMETPAAQKLMGPQAHGEAAMHLRHIVQAQI